MSNEVQFDTDTQNDAIRRPVGSVAGFGQPMSDAAGMAGWLVRHGFAKTSTGAQGIMIAVVAVDIIATFVVIKYFL